MIYMYHTFTKFSICFPGLRITMFIPSHGSRSCQPLFSSIYRYEKSVTTGERSVRTSLIVIECFPLKTSAQLEISSLTTRRLHTRQLGR